ncbi:MAG: SurA N-terminal domain-containing protein [Chitinophagaceae bacterium]|nr:SurA N-terminal domain-containing protein [Chitinophagaceae bacterium]
MSIIQTIRDKGATITVVIVALALLGFVLTDYFSSRTQMAFGSSSDVIGVVNGRKIRQAEFSKRVKMAEDIMRQQGYPSTSATSAMAEDNTWDQEVTRIIMEEEFKKLGIVVSKKELGDILYGPNAPEDLKKQFTDPKTGQYNALEAKRQIDQILKRGAPEMKASLNNYIDQLIYQRQYEKYMSLFTHSANVPRWYVEKQNADNSLMGKASFVKELYTAVPDSVVKVEDREIADYIRKHREEYKQEESRTISYVIFDVKPSAADTAEALKRINELKITFDTTTNLEQFFAREGVDASVNYDGYKSEKSITSSYKDSIIRMSPGSVFGPYIEGNRYFLARLEGARRIPDTVKVRHILIATEQTDPQTGQKRFVRDTTAAYKLADSLKNVIAKGGNFDSLCAKFSDDPGSKDKGGVYENIYSGQMVGPFNDFIFLNPTGAKGIVKTVYGYHYIEILSQKGSTMGYKISYLPQDIIISGETENNVNNEVNLFAGESRDLKSFDANYEKNLKPKGIQKSAASVTRKDSQIPGIGFSKRFIKKIFEAKAGEVLKPERVDDKYVVAVVTEVLKEGLMPVYKARPTVEVILRNKKKAEILRQKAGKFNSLEDVSRAWGGKPIEKVDSLKLSGNFITALGYEPRIIGAIFNPDNKGKLIPAVLEGINGVFVVKVDSITTTPVTTGSIADQRKEQANQRRGMANPVEALRKEANIKDRRLKFY